VKAFKMRAYPTHGQEVRANRMLRVHCDIYNACLEERIKAYKMCGVSVSYKMQSAQLSDVRTGYPAAAEFSFSAEQRTVKRVDRAFQAFFDRIKRGDTPGFPRYKSWRRFDTADHTAGDGSKWVPTEGKWAKAYFQGVGHLKVSEHTPIVGKVKTLSLVRDGRKWFVVVVADAAPDLLEPTGLTVGVDVGITRFLTTSDGEVVDNPRFLRAAADDLADLQRRYEMTGKRSKNLKRAIAKLHRKVKNQRLDFHHQTARRLVDTYDLIAVEDLKVKQMGKRAKAKPDTENPGSFLPNGGAAKTGLNRSIADVAWAQFRAILTAKAENAGRVVVAVNPAYTSIRCHACQTTCERPTQAVVICPTHGPCDADLNGARNIYGRGLASSVAA
jgi:putative transposase